MLDVTRYRGVLVVAGCVLAALVLGDWLLGTVAGRWPLWLLPAESPIGWEGTEVAAERVAGVAVSERRRTGGAGAGLAVILGRSTAREGLDPTLLEACGPESLRWLSLYGSGGSLNYLTDLADILFFSRLEPEVVVLAINPYMLAGHPYRPNESSTDADVFGPLSAGELYAAQIALVERIVSHSWLLAHRPIINYQAHVGSFRTRLRVFRLCGLESDALRPPDPDPWKVTRLSFPETESRLSEALAVAEKLGRFSAASYSVGSTQAAALADVVARSRARGATVYVVLLPERSLWRSKVPAEAELCLRAVLDQHFDGSPPPVIDLRASLSDEMFNDHFHLNVRGAEALSRLLISELRRLGL